MGKKTVVFGSFVVDLTGRTPHLPAPAETVKGSSFKSGPGGKGFNQAVAAHKAGADITCVTKLGRDDFANVALNVMDELKMPKDYMLYSDDVETGVALILVDENTSQNEIVVIPGACGTITAEEVDGLEELVKDAEYVLVQLEVNTDANERFIRMAHKCGAKVILNTAPYQPVPDDVMALAYMVTPNEVEAEEMTGVHVDDLESAKKAAAVFREKGVETVVITLGSKGVFISCDGREEIIPCFKVKAVETTGAGDAFNGGLLTGLSEGKDIWESARFASALAAISVTRYGTTPAMPTREEIEAFLKEH